METKIYKNYKEFITRNNKKANGVSEEFATKYPNYKIMNTTNKGCWNCLDCDDCYYCNECNSCFNCRECASCCFCNNCYKCNICNLCKKCSDCNNCKECYNCKECNNCKKCNNCEKCNNCKKCNSCKKLDVDIMGNIYIKENNKKMKPNHIKNHYDTFRKMYNNGTEMQDIAKHFGMSRPAICFWRDKFNLQQRGKGCKIKINKKDYVELNNLTLLTGNDIVLIMQNHNLTTKIFSKIIGMNLVNFHRIIRKNEVLSDCLIIKLISFLNIYGKTQQIKHERLCEYCKNLRNNVKGE